MRRESAANSLLAARTSERDAALREIEALRSRLKVLDEQEELKRKIAKLDEQLMKEKVNTDAARYTHRASVVQAGE
jgi:hypothetical protein